MYRGTRRRTWRRGAVLVVLAIVIPQLILAAVLATGLGVLPGSDNSTLTNANADPAGRRLAVGDCVHRGDGGKEGYGEIGCSDHRAYGKVVALVEGDTDATEGCTADTDFFATQPNSKKSDEVSQVACLRRLDNDHPGAPGEGGGVYRAGDCVASSADPAVGVREVPCGDPEVFEVITKRVKTVAECAAPAYRFAALQHGAARILCLGDGPGIASPGECMDDPSSGPITFAAVDCGSSQARAEVLERVASAQACRTVPRQTHYVEDPSGLPATRVVCLAVKP